MALCWRGISNHHDDNEFTAFHIRKPVGKQQTVGEPGIPPDLIRVDQGLVQIITKCGEEFRMLVTDMALPLVREFYISPKMRTRKPRHSFL